jgi:hypothetical protein
MLDDAWWERVDLTIKIMEPIISLLRFVDTNKPILGKVYEGWDSMIESMRTIILQNESPEYGTPTKIFFTTIHDILISKWNKNCSPLHCLAHSLNPEYYNSEWLNGGTSRRFPPHMDHELSEGRKEAFRQIYQDRASFDEVEAGFIDFSTASERFSSYDVLRDRGAKKPHAWWATHGETCPPLHELAMRILSQVTSSSCCERN